ncbi:MAG: hypothetical protein M0C28_09035 [Candidatus Moduliflexus flocculans]|nr:hypothetical protein [Candidatus Moduliflexus flocculans]
MITMGDLHFSQIRSVGVSSCLTLRISSFAFISSSAEKSIKILKSFNAFTVAVFNGIEFIFHIRRKSHDPEPWENF